MGNPRSKDKALPANVHRLSLVEIGDDCRVNARRVLKRARAEKLDEIMVIGRDDKGELWAMSSLNGGQSLWLIEKLRERILSGNPWSIV